MSTETQSLTSFNNKKGSFTSDATDEEFGLAMSSMYKYSTRFDGLEDNTEYTVNIIYALKSAGALERMRSMSLERLQGERQICERLLMNVPN